MFLKVFAPFSVRAGLPVCVWPFAAEYYCVIENSRLRTDAEWGPNVAKPGVAQQRELVSPGHPARSLLPHLV